MRMSDLFPSKYLRAAEVNEPRVETVDHVTHEPFREDGVSVQKTVIHFRKSGTNTPPLVVNKSNWRAMVEITGSDDDDHWAGHQIQLRVERVSAPGGKIVPSVRIYEVPKPAKAKGAVLAFNDEVPY